MSTKLASTKTVGRSFDVHRIFWKPYPTNHWWTCFFLRCTRLWYWFSSKEAVLIYLIAKCHFLSSFFFFLFRFFPFFSPFNIARTMQEKEVKRWFDHVDEYPHNKITSSARLFNLPDKGMVWFSSWKLKINKFKLKIYCRSLALKISVTCLGCIFHHLKPLTQEKPLSLSKIYASNQPEIAGTITGIS